MQTFFEFIKKTAIEGSNAEFEQNFDTIASGLSQDQLLLLIVLIDILLTLDKAPTDNPTMPRLFYVFDNIDIIYDTRVLDDFIQHYVFFVENTSSLFVKIHDNTEYKLNFYENLVFVFVMRETSSMAISDHFNDRLQYLSMHFDLSNAVDKSKIVKKKHEYLFRLPEGKSSRRLRTAVERINLICSDKYIRNNIFPMFNNDYKRTMACLSRIIDTNPIYISDFLQLNESNNDYCKRGARGIIFRLIFDHFKDCQYFDNIGVSIPNQPAYGLTPARLILTYLSNIQLQQNPHFLQNDNDAVFLSSLFNNFKNVFSENNDSNTEAFMQALWGMFDLRKVPSWNHLITFDAIKHVSYEDILDHLTNPVYDKPSIKIRLTCAGRNYVRFVCVHYEFFAARFGKSKYPLYSSDSTMFNQAKKKYLFEILMENVLEAVKKCCVNLDASENRAFIESKRFTAEELLNSNFCYRNYDNNKSYYHAERIIHHHIGYIDSYRLFLINGKFANNVVDINIRIIKYILEYIDLLQQYHQFSNESSELAAKLKHCIKIIQEASYQDRTTRIATIQN